MAAPESGMVTFIIVAGFFCAILLYGYAYEYITPFLIKMKIRSFKVAPIKKKGAPLLIKGPAHSPDLILPSTGEHVSFYALFILSKETSTSGSRGYAGIDRCGGIRLRAAKRITDLEGFRFFTMSGDVSVISEGIPYDVSISSAFALFSKGAVIVTSLVSGTSKNAGIPESVLQETTGLIDAEVIFRYVLGFTVSIKTTKSVVNYGGKDTLTTYSVPLFVTSSIDSRIHEYISGINLPTGIQEILVKKGIVIRDKEEIIVIETFIPLGKEVYVFGTFDGDKTLIYKYNYTRLSVSYTDPEFT